MMKYTKSVGKRERMKWIVDVSVLYECTLYVTTWKKFWLDVYKNFVLKKTVKIYCTKCYSIFLFSFQNIVLLRFYVTVKPYGRSMSVCFSYWFNFPEGFSVIVMLLPLIDPDTKRGVDYSTINHEQHSINKVNNSTTPPWKNFSNFRLFRAIAYFFLKHF